MGMAASTNAQINAVDFIACILWEVKLCQDGLLPEKMLTERVFFPADHRFLKMETVAEKYGLHAENTESGQQNAEYDQHKRYVNQSAYQPVLPFEMV